MIQRDRRSEGERGRARERGSEGARERQMGSGMDRPTEKERNGEITYFSVPLSFHLKWKVVRRDGKGGSER